MEGKATRRTVIFILSEIRSGSTWLSYVLGSHDPIVHLGEYHRPFIIPGHVACRLCEAKGLPECEVLHGIEKVPTQQAHDFAFERFGKPILCDASKSLEWTANFLNQDRYQVKAVHLMRDPRGWFASQRRRTPMSADEAVGRWAETNQRILDFVAYHRIACCNVFYDDLAVRPDRYFPRLCRFLEVDYQSNALEYWNREHHGLGGNGAALNVIGQYQNAQVTTGDDPFYQANAQKRFYDARWREQLDESERKTFEQSSAVRLLLEMHDRDFAHFDELVGANASRTGLWARYPGLIRRLKRLLSPPA